jgi:hypothetical protein
MSNKPWLDESTTAKPIKRKDFDNIFNQPAEFEWQKSKAYKKMLKGIKKDILKLWKK